jgi:hypothetical protein
VNFAAAIAPPICLWKCILAQSEQSSYVDFYYQRNSPSHRAQKGLGAAIHALRAVFSGFAPASG